MIGQCFSVLPLLMFFSVETVKKRRQMQEGIQEGIYLKKGEIFMMFFGAALAGGVEIVLFRAACTILM